MTTDRRETLLERIRDETRQAVIEGDAQDCASADCIADAVYEIVRAALTAAPVKDSDRLFQAVRRVIRDGIDSPGTYNELHEAFYAVRDARPAREETPRVMDIVDQSIDDLSDDELLEAMEMVTEPDVSHRG